MFTRQFLNTALGRMNSLQQVVEGEAAFDRDRDLAVEHKSLGAQLAEDLDQLRKISRQRLSGFRLQIELRSVAEDETTEAIPFWLILPAVAIGDLLDEE